MLPILGWNLLLAKALPPAYQNENWNSVPRTLKIVENALRTTVFVFTVFLRLEIRNGIQLSGLVIYSIGLGLYFASWMVQIRFSNYGWSKNIIAFAAPAYTSLIWLWGIGFIGQHLLINVVYAYWIYLVLSVSFVAVHTLHSILAFKNLK